MHTPQFSAASLGWQESGVSAFTDLVNPGRLSL